MAYTINKSDGSILTELIDNSIDQTSTSITLIGKNVSNYGELFNENLVKILENFANTSAPNFPITGQLWFDTNQNRLKIYDGSGFKASSGPIVSDSPPTSPVQGDIWIDSKNNQVFFYDGIDSRILAGPIYTDAQGLSGFEVANVADVSGNIKTVLKTYVGETLIGIFSKEAFTPGTSIEGFSGSIIKGFTSSTLSDAKWDITATKADAIVDVTGALRTANSFVSTAASGGNTSMAATLTIQNTKPFIIGPSQNNEVSVTPSSFVLTSNSSKQNYKIQVRNGGTTTDALTIIPDVSTTAWYVGIMKSNPSSTLDVNGSFNVSGSATVGNNLRIDGNLTTTWITMTAAYSASPGDQIIADTTSGPFTITLPASPSIGTTVRIIDGSGSGFAANNLTIARNGNKINGLSSDLTVTTTGSAFGLVYTGANRGWAYDRS